VNPFEIVGEGEEAAQKGILPGSQGIHFESRQLKSFVCVGDGDENEVSGDVVMTLEGLWEPRTGAIVRLMEPNRDAKVYAQLYEVTGTELSSFVYIVDPKSEDARARSGVVW
jgi:hypothetical protein